MDMDIQELQEMADAVKENRQPKLKPTAFEIEDIQQSAQKFCEAYVPLGAQSWLVEALSYLIQTHIDRALKAERHRIGGWLEHYENNAPIDVQAVDIIDCLRTELLNEREE